MGLEHCSSRFDISTILTGAASEGSVTKWRAVYWITSFSSSESELESSSGSRGRELAMCDGSEVALKRKEGALFFLSSSVLLAPAAPSHGDLAAGNNNTCSEVPVRDHH